MVLGGQEIETQQLSHLKESARVCVCVSVLVCVCVANTLTARAGA